MIAMLRIASHLALLAMFTACSLSPDLPKQSPALADMEEPLDLRNEPNDEEQRLALPVGTFSGLYLSDARDTLAAKLEDPDSVKIERVIENSPAHLAGLQAGDLVLEVEIDGRGVGRIPYSRIEALAVAAVSGLSARPVLVMDLVLNWKADPAEPLKLIRIKGNLFDPLSLAPEAESPLHALKEIIATIADRSGAECLPDSAAVAGDPFRRFQDLAQYEQAILGISS